MILPKVIAIDTYVYEKVAKDFYSRDSGRYKRALSFIDFITNNGLIPFFSLHHLEEILQHENDMIVQDRLSFIRKFPAVAWLKSVNNSGIVGSILDIQGMELKRIIETPDIKIPDLISEVWKELIQYSSGEEFLDRFEDLLWQLRESYPFETQSKKITASISHVVNDKTGKEKLEELKLSELRTFEEAQSIGGLFRKSLESKLIKRGDKKLEKTKQVAADFVSEVMRKGAKMYENNDDSLYESFLQLFDVNLQEVNSDTTIEDLGYLATYKKKLKIVAESLGLEVDKVLSIPQQALPSWVIWLELDKILKKQDCAEGSSITDKYMAILSLYVDILVVDKRFKEYFKQLKSKRLSISEHINKVVSLSSYDKLGEILGTHT